MVVAILKASWSSLEYAWGPCKKYGGHPKSMVASSKLLRTLCIRPGWIIPIQLLLFWFKSHHYYGLVVVIAVLMHCISPTCLMVQTNHKQTEAVACMQSSETAVAIRVTSLTFIMQNNETLINSIWIFLKNRQLKLMLNAQISINIVMFHKTSLKNIKINILWIKLFLKNYLLARPNGRSGASHTHCSHDLKVTKNQCPFIKLA